MARFIRNRVIQAHAKSGCCRGLTQNERAKPQCLERRAVLAGQRDVTGVEAVRQREHDEQRRPWSGSRRRCCRSRSRCRSRGRRRGSVRSPASRRRRHAGATGTWSGTVAVIAASIAFSARLGQAPGDAHGQHGRGLREHHHRDHAHDESAQHPRQPAPDPEHGAVGEGAPHRVQRPSTPRRPGR